MVAQNLTKQPTFFGCNATKDTPLLLYLPNAPWTGYTNYSYTLDQFTDEQLDIAFDNAFQVATYGNGTVDPDWPACLACAAIKGALQRTNTKLPSQCQECFDRHCWNGMTSSREVTDADFDLRPRLNTSLTYEEWNETDWSAGSSNSTSGKDDDSAGSKVMGSFAGVSLSVFLMAALLM